MSSDDKILFTVQEDWARLDKFLAQQLPEYSRTYLQERIRVGGVTLNGKKQTSVKEALKPGDIVGLTHQARPGFNLTPQQVPFEVVDVQEDFIVINKPAGLLVHAPANRSQEITLVNGLLYLFKDLEELLKTDDRPGIVHRLDEDTSGLLLIARNERGKAGLTKLFQDRKIIKKYHTVVRGHPPRTGQVTFPIGRHLTIPTRMSHQTLDGKPAHSAYTVLKYLEGSTLLEVQIFTGRTHQIRVHCAAIGHGVLGDKTYGAPSPHISRQALHAAELEFFYAGKQFSYKATIPDDMQTLIAALDTLPQVE